MPTKKLTDLMIRALKAPQNGRLEYWDTIVEGFGIRLTENDARTWFIMYRIGEGARRKQRRLKIGNAKIMGLGEARGIAREKLRLVEAGIDPAEQPKQTVKTEEAGTHTVESVLREYFRKHVDEKTSASHAKETKRIFERDVLPAIGACLLKDVTRRDIDAILEALVQRDAKISANRTLTRLKTFFTWAVDQDYIEASPVARIKAPAKENERDRDLDPNELRWFLRACGDLGWPFGHLYKFLLLTLQRRDEAADLEWDEIDLEKRLWTIPRHRSKNDKAHEVHLSEQAIGILQYARRLTGNSRYVFTTNGESPVSGFSKSKARLASLMEQYRAAENGKPIVRFTLHDLRRTGATGMGGLGIAPHVVDKILNHVGGTIRGVALIYNRFQYFDERRAALEAWGKNVDTLAIGADRALALDH